MSFFTKVHCLFLTNVQVAGFDTSTSIGLGVVLLLLFCSGLVSGSEVAFFSISNNDISKLENSGNSNAKKILKLLEQPRYLLSTILIANNFINIGIIIVSGFVLENILPAQLPSIAIFSLTISTKFLIEVILVTFLLVLFGEIAPKVYASENKMRIASMMSSALLTMRGLFKPISWTLVNSTQIIEKRLQKRAQEGAHNFVSSEDISQAIELTVKGTKYGKQDISLLKGIVQFGNTSTKNIMRSRMYVVAVDLNTDFHDLLNLFRKSSYSRIPVYDKTLDNIKGIIYGKDLLNNLGKDKNFQWHSLMRDAFFVPENKKIDDLFADFRERRTHMAIVVDEYGGTSGLITLEDVLEEIVGEIRDEFDEPDDIQYTKLDDFNYIFDGGTLLVDVCKVTETDISLFEETRQGAETIAGLILVTHGFIPKKNTQVRINGYSFTILASNERRIQSVRFTIPKRAVSN